MLSDSYVDSYTGTGFISGQPHLSAFFRDRRAESIYRAESPDDGKTWSKPTKTTLPNNNSGIEATVLQSGNLAIVYNPTHKARNPLSVSLSTDQGLSVPDNYPTVLRHEYIDLWVG